jgi:hypothetical protein
MKFYEILTKTKWEDVEKSLQKHYPNYMDSIGGFKKVYYELFTLKPKYNEKFQIHIEKDDFWSVSGYSTEEDSYYGIEYVRWENWLGYDLHPDSLVLSNEDIVAHCLWEMTWAGFFQEKIEEKVKYLKKLSEEADEMIKNYREQ